MSVATYGASILGGIGTVAAAGTALTMVGTSRSSPYGTTVAGVGITAAALTGIKARSKIYVDSVVGKGGVFSPTSRILAFQNMSRRGIGKAALGVGAIMGTVGLARRTTGL